MTTWKRAEMSHCELADSDFSEANLPDSRLLYCDLSGVELSKANLAGSHLFGSKLDGIYGGESLRDVRIGTDQIISAALAVFADLGIALWDEP
jgi:uncharacterized protein YjbI with pentapeptide repeats